MAEPRRGVMLVSDVPDSADLVAGLPVAVLLVDPAGCIARANVACETLLNVSERQLVGRPFAGVFPAIERDRRAGHGLSAFDVEVDTRAGRLRIDFADSELADHPGWRAVALHSAANSRRLAHAADRAAAARAAVGAAAMLAHEIKNPLSGIRGAAQLIAGGAPPDDLTTLITTEVDRIAALIDRMEDFTDSRPLKLEPLNIYPLLYHAREVALAGFARGLSVDDRFDPSLPPVLGNADALLQIVINLLKNAAEAVGPADNITIATAFRHGMAVAPAPGLPRRPLPIEIAVIDDGPGAPDDIAEHLFDPFVSSRPEGKGLGLALVDKLTRDMGGMAQYGREGEPPRTVFRIFLPRADF